MQSNTAYKHTAGKTAQQQIKAEIAQCDSSGKDSPATLSILRNCGSAGNAL